MYAVLRFSRVGRVGDEVLTSLAILASEPLFELFSLRAFLQRERGKRVYQGIHDSHGLVLSIRCLKGLRKPKKSIKPDFVHKFKFLCSSTLTGCGS